MQCADHTASAELLGMAERSVMLATTSGCTAGSKSTRSCVQLSNIAGSRAPPRGPQPAFTARLHQEFCGGRLQRTRRRFRGRELLSWLVPGQRIAARRLALLLAQF